MTDTERELLEEEISDCEEEIESLRDSKNDYGGEIRWLEEKIADAEYALSRAEEDLEELKARLKQED